MPYTVDNPPSAVKGLPKHAIEIYVAAFNSAFEQYKDEGKAAATAWAAVKTKYKKNEQGDWVAKEAKVNELKAKHDEIIQEIGRRNAAKDEKRIRDIMSLCQELLSNADAPAEKVAEALKEADSVLVWLKEQAVVKTEDGVEFPAEAYAYVPDSESPSEWKLRLWEDPTQKVTRKQLGAAAAALSPGGFRGQRVDIPANDLPAVKRKIRAAYRSLDIPDEEMPRWVKEAESRALLTGFVSLTEAHIDGKAMVTVIKPGFNFTKDRYYLQETLTRDYPVFEGVKMYADHPSEDDERNRPERSIRDWVATLKNVHVDKGNIIGEAVIVEPWLKEKLATLRDNGMLSEMGVSINAVGTATQGEMEGIKTNIIERIVRARSVDFVTEAGAGGLVQMYEAEKDIDIDFVSLASLKERRPDLVKQIEDDKKNTLMKEVRMTVELEEEIKTLKEQNGVLTEENTNLKKDKETAEKASRIAEAKALVDKAVGEADLPEPAKARILERFKDSESADGLTEAIETEKTYVASITEAGKVKGLGGGSEDPEAGHKALVESFKATYLREGKSEEEAQKMAEIAARGR